MNMLALVLTLLASILLPASARAQEEPLQIVAPADARVIHIDITSGGYVYSGDTLATLKKDDGTVIVLRAGVAGKVLSFTARPYQRVAKDSVLGTIQPAAVVVDIPESGTSHALPSLSQLATNLFRTTGVYGIIDGQLHQDWTVGIGRVLMIVVGLVLLYLGIFRQFEPLLLVPIGYGAILSNIPLAGMVDPGGILAYIYDVGISSGVFPLLIFMGVGALTDFGPMIANPKTILLGGAAQLGIFFTLIGALLLSDLIPGINFSLRDAASIGIIGGADGPMAIFVTMKLAPHLLPQISVAAYSYMALMPLIQPPVMKLLTTKEERMIRMRQSRQVTRLERIAFPIVIGVIVNLFFPPVAPLITMLMLGNLFREVLVVERLAKTAANDLMNVIIIMLTVAIGSTMSADKFLTVSTLEIVALGLVAFVFGTASGVVGAKIMNLFLTEKINPLLGSAGIASVPIAARVSHVVALEDDKENYLIYHAMGPNLAGVFGTAISGGIMLALLGVK